jgi:murein DD-endopeptidase MepM/ murein hydrolase activator NlpD
MARPGSVLCAAVLTAAVASLATPADDLPPPPPLQVVETVVLPGDTWERALLRLGVDRGATTPILAQLRTLVNLRRLRPGQLVRVVRDPDGDLVRLVYRHSAIDRYVVGPGRDGWVAQHIQAPVDTRVVAVAGRVVGSLFNAMDRLGESPLLTAKFVEIFESEFDFAADSLPGDRFRLLVEKDYVRGEFVGYGRILVARYETPGRRPLTGVAIETASGTTQYYDAHGHSMQKMFLRSPLDFTRITSGFSHARYHPILGGLRPHLAIDYAAPVGTPVRAVADGVVASAGWEGGNGISVRIRHPRGYETMYNHLSRVHVRLGERVSQRQVIGRVGSTGLATGPHLDYRVIKNGRFVNPLREKFIPGPSLSGAERRAFDERVRTLLHRLERDTAEKT